MDSYDAIISDLKKKIYHPIYLLEGEESYYIDRIADFIEDNVLTEEEKSFNLTILYGKDINGIDLLEMVKRFPMMSNYLVVIVKEAQQIKGLEKLLTYVENPLKSTLLVLCYKNKKLDKRTKFAKVISKKALVFTSGKIYENKIPSWIAEYLQKLNYRITPKATMLLADYLGSDLSKITNELDKLTLNVSEGQEIDVDIVEQLIGISKDYNVFEFQNALGSKDVLRSNRIVEYFINNPKGNPVVIIIGSLFRFYSSIYRYHFHGGSSDMELAGILKVNPYFVKDYKVAGHNYTLAQTENVIDILQEYDLRMKGINNVNVKEGELLKEMTYKILHLPKDKK